MKNSFSFREKISLGFSIIMICVFLGIAFLFLFTELLSDRYPKPNRTYIGLLLGAWACFRGASIWLRYKKIKSENED
ncbi:MAG: hypothetical protein EXR20_06445 [Bacteroidetes bacterium]|nr:hypothetical protein [Bacteroidota bacterium]